MKSLIIDLKNQCVFYPEDIDRIKNLLDCKFHIYAILLSHKYYLNRTEIKQTKDGIFLPVFSPTNTNSFVIPFQVQKGIDHRKLTIDVQYPGEKFTVNIEDDEWKSNNPDKEYCLVYNITKIVDKLLFKTCAEIEYKIAYIGQSYGTDGSRIAVDRLFSHSTLQKVLCNCQSISSEYSVRILLMDFEQDYNIDFAQYGSFNALVSTQPQLSENQIINIAEAALIHFFKPEYNKDFVSTFPSEKHTSYREIYDKGYTEVTLDLSYLYEASPFPFLDLYTDHNRISKEKYSIRYKMRRCDSVLTSIPFDN